MASRIKTIVLTTDFSDCSRVAIPTALDLAKTLPAKLILVHVIIPLTSYPSYPYGMVLELHEREENMNDLISKATQELEVWLGNLAQDIEVEKVVLDGYPAERIVNYLKDKNVDLVIIGTHGFGPLKRFLLGSVANYIVHKSPCPVLTVRAEEE